MELHFGSNYTAEAAASAMDIKYVDLSYDRIGAISRWLTKRVTPMEAVEAVAERDKIPTTLPTLVRCMEFLARLLFFLWVFDLLRHIQEEPPRTERGSFSNWVIENLQDSDELWEYDSGPECEKSGCDECGYAIVRNGEVVDFWVRKSVDVDYWPLPNN